MCVCVYKRIVCKGRKCENEFFLGNFLTGLRRHAHIRVVSRARATAKRRIYIAREMVGGCVCVSGDGKRWLRVKGKSKKKPNSSGPDERSLRRLYILIYICIYEENAREYYLSTTHIKSHFAHAQSQIPGRSHSRAPPVVVVSSRRDLVSISQSPNHG